jgi:hypothetical protein
MEEEEEEEERRRRRTMEFFQFNLLTERPVKTQEKM